MITHARQIVWGSWIVAAAMLLAQPVQAYLPVTYDSNGFFHQTSSAGPYVGYKPDTYNAATPISLLVWMHGCGGDSEGDMWEICPPSTRSNQSYIAISIGGRDGDCWDVNSDTPKVLAAITDVARYFNINPRKIYLSGYSSGGDLTYRVGFQNTSLFAGLLVENSDPFRDTGATQASLLASASWKINIAHLAHLQDTTYPIATVRASLTTLTNNGFPVVKIEKNGTHYDPDSGATGTDYDFIHFLLPYVDAGWTSPGAGADIAVEQPLGTSVASGSTQSMTTTLGTPVALTFTIKNPGTANLTGLTITKDGTNAADFSITTNPTAPVAPSGSTTFTLTFSPGASGAKTAAIHIASNVTGKTPYDINFSGRGLSFSEDTDGDGLSDAAEWQWRALGFDWQVSQPALVSTFKANANAAGFFTTAQVQSMNVGTPLLTRDPNTGGFLLTIGLQKAATLGQPFADFPMNAAGMTTTINSQGKVEFRFTVPDSTAFFRLNSK